MNILKVSSFFALAIDNKKLVNYIYNLDLTAIKDATFYLQFMWKSYKGNKDKKSTYRKNERWMLALKYMPFLFLHT